MLRLIFNQYFEIKIEFPHIVAMNCVFISFINVITYLEERSDEQQAKPVCNKYTTGVDCAAADKNYKQIL